MNDLTRQANEAAQLPVKANVWPADAPRAVLRLQEAVDGWFRKYQSGDLRSTDDLDITLGGMSGTFPHVHYYLWDVVEYAKKFSNNSNMHERLTKLAVDGLKGLTVYYLQTRLESGTRLNVGGGCIMTASSLLQSHKIVRPGSPMDEALADQFADSFGRVFKKKSEKERGDASVYLIESLYFYGHDIGKQYNESLHRGIEKSFTLLWQKEMDQSLKEDFMSTMERYKDPFKSYMKDLVQKAENPDFKPSAAVLPSTVGRLTSSLRKLLPF